MLVDAGASVLVLDGGGLSSRELAILADDLELAKYLKFLEDSQVRQTCIKGMQSYLKVKLIRLDLITKLNLIF